MNALPDAPVPGAGRHLLAPAEGATPHDRCVRCGVETPAGVSLCPEHNPGRIRAPSSTQMHATILGGVLLGILGFFLLAPMLQSPAGPFSVDLFGTASDGSGGLLLGLAVVNDGDAAGVAQCRITRDGTIRPDDYSFRTERIAPGGRLVIERAVSAPPAGIGPYVVDQVTVTCQ